MSGFRGQVPNLVLAQRVIDKMAAAASQYIQDETGEAMIGLLEPGTYTNGVPTLYVLETLPPDETDVVREYYTFQHGGEHQFEILTWYHLNWKAWRKRLNEGQGDAKDKKYDLPLVHIGDWHKQPGYMIAPSGGDLMSAMAQLNDTEDEDTDTPPFLLVPIATLGHPNTVQGGPGANFVTAPMPDETHSHMRVDFWYIHRDYPVFQSITPVVYPDEQLPKLPPLPWQIADPARADLEFGQLQHAGWFVSIVLWDTDGVLPLEVCVMTAQQGQSTVILIVTGHDFPETAPKAYRAPFISMGDSDDIYAMFDKMWSQATLIDNPPGWKWSPDLYLIDYVAAIQQAEAKKTAATATASVPPAETTSPAAAAAPVAAAPVSEASPVPAEASPAAAPGDSAQTEGSAQSEGSGGAV